MDERGENEVELEEIRKLYTKRAGNYDLTSNLYRLIGIRMTAYRKEAVHELKLKKGNTVLDMACGTGLNFGLLEEKIGEEGEIIGLDYTEAMLEKARERIRRNNWKNIHLIQEDASKLDLKEKVDGVLCTFAFSIMPNYEEAIKRSVAALRKGGRLVTLDIKLPSGPWRFLNSLGVLLTKPFGGSYEAGRRKMWEKMGELLQDVNVQEHYLGIIYIVSGTKG